MYLIKTFYKIKPFIPRWLQIYLRRQIAFYRRKKYAHLWPIDHRASEPPEDWPGWPGGKKFALVLTHDVDTKRGHNNVLKLMDLEERAGFNSSFNFVAERYNVSVSLRNRLSENGFEVGVHGLKHDGKLYSSKEIFNERALRINQYIRAWGASGFRSPAMHHNLEWMHQLQIMYDASTFDTDPFEPQSDGVRTIFPFWVNNGTSQEGYLELPYTLPQDFTLFILMKGKNIDIWKNKLKWIAEKGGMALINTHPDYMIFTEDRPGMEEYPAEYYREFLDYVRTKYQGQYWQALPNEVARFWLSKIIK